MHRKDYYTVEELSDLTGYAVSFIYDLTHYCCVVPPIRGLVKGTPGRGLYPAEALKQLRRYMELKRAGLKRSDIFNIMKSELQSLGAECSSITKVREKRLGV